MLLCRVLLQIPRYHPESQDSLDSRQSLPSSSPLSNFPEYIYRFVTV